MPRSGATPRCAAERHARWRSVTSTPAPATAASTSSGAVSNPFYDLPRLGLDIVASPRHADILLVTGPVTTRMATPLRRAYEAMPEPRLVAALGDCALGCGVLGDPGELIGSLEAVVPVDIRVPGCPPTPEAIAEHQLARLGPR